MASARRPLVPALVQLLVLLAPLVTSASLPAAPSENSSSVRQAGGAGEASDSVAAAAAKTGRREAVSVGTGSPDTETEVPRPDSAGTGSPDPRQARQDASSQTFFTYGAALAGTIYGLMGIGYFYGPYSKQALLAKMRAERRRQYLEQVLRPEDDTERHDIYHNYYQETGRGQAGYVPQQYSTGYVPEYAPGYAGYGPLPVQLEQEQDGASGRERRFQLVMAREGAEPYPEGINRSGAPAAIPIRLRRGVGRDRRAADLVVNVLNMESTECVSWVNCLRRRTERALLEGGNRNPYELDPSCDSFFFTCPTIARRLSEIIVPPGVQN